MAGALLLPMLPRCISEICTSTGCVPYESLAVACVYRNASYLDTHVPLGRLLVITLMYTYVSSSEFFFTVRPASASRFASVLSSPS